ncbi:MAG: hypothetical protein Q8S84_05300 [bacterium]|nr:hypothetical protein [bacterium]
MLEITGLQRFISLFISVNSVAVVPDINELVVFKYHLSIAYCFAFGIFVMLVAHSVHLQ